MTQRDIEWNAANFRLQVALDDDPAFQSMAVELDPTVLSSWSNPVAL